MGPFKTFACLTLCFLSVTALAHNRPALEYVQNLGQWESDALFRIGMGGGAIFLEEDCFTFHFVHGDDRASMHDFSQWSPEQQAAFNMRGHAWKMHFEGALDATISGEKQANHYYNYFLGDDKLKWASKVGIYEAVTYDDIYEGVDIRCYNRASNFKYDFILDPGVDPQVIDLRFEGLDGILIVDGKLVLKTAIGDFKEMQPYCYQLKNEKLVEVPCEYMVDGEQVSFHFPEGYDPAYKLVIDPELIAATLSGTNGDDNYGHTATFDLTGIIYTGAISFGVGYPATTGAYEENYNSGAGWGTDIAVSKLTADGTDLIWASYLGGGEGDYPHSIVANTLGELYVYGSTTANDFPTTSGAFQEDHNGDSDIIVSHFSSDGSELIGSTYMGGSLSDGRNLYSINYGDTYRGEIILDEGEKPLIASFASSGDFPTTLNAYQSGNTGGQDAVVFRMNALLTNLEACTMLGSSENDSGYGVRVTSSGDIYVAGMAGASNFPLTAGAYQTEFLGGGDEWSGEADGFVAILNSSCTVLEASTLYGTTMQDQIFFLDLDNDENVFVYGQGGQDMPIVGDVYSNPDSRQFITKFNPGLTAVEISTQIGTGSGDAGTTDFVPIAFLVDHCNNVYISAHGANTWGGGELPLTGDALYDGTNGESFYLAVLSEDLVELEFGTMYTSNHVDGGTSRFDKNGTVYQAVCSGGDFATTADAWAPNQSTGWDIGVFKIDFDVSGVNSAITGSDVNGCAPFEVELQNFSTGDIFFWDFGDGTTSDEFEPSHIFEDPGNYTISLIASDSLSCNLADTSYFDIQISVPTDFVPEFTWSTNCETIGITTNNLTDVEWLDYIWDMGDGTVLEGYNVEYNYEVPGDYTVSLLAIDNGCMDDEQVAYDVTIFDQVVAVIENDDEDGCAPLEINFNNNSSGQTFTWDFGDGSAPVEGSNVVHTFEEAGNYVVLLTAEGSGDCTGTSTDEILVEVINGPFINPNFLVNQVDDCELKTVQIEDLSEGDDLEYWWDMGDGATYSSQNPDHIYDEPGTFTITLTIYEPVCDQDQVMMVDVQVVEALDMELPPDITICHYVEGVALDGANLGPGATYEWSTGETTQSIFATEPGVYTLEGTTNNCTGSDEIIVSQSPQINTDHTITACEGTQAYIQVPYDGSSEYNWCQGEATQYIYADEPGDYCFQFVDELGCLQEGNVHLIHINHDADLYIPNTFTPNNDGRNDVFLPVGTEVRDYEFSVFNRWGDLVFETEDQSQVWDGSYQGSDHYIQDGVYSFKVAYNGTCSAEKIVKTGYITVIR